MTSLNEVEPFDAKTFLKNVTKKPGVYQMLNSAHQRIYVGKAKSLKKRLSSYFNRDDKDVKKRVMVSHIASIEVIETHTEGEALLLEAQLIKRYKPRYNICLRDDKSYPYIYLSLDQPFPRLSFHRGARRGKGQYFGPYPSAGAVRDSLNTLQKLFTVRQCDDSFYKNRSRPCLQHQIKRCSAPCVGLISEKNYRMSVEHTVFFLEGKNKKLIDHLVQQMEKASDALDFERAAEFRDQISNLRKVTEKQYISGKGGDLDVIACSVTAEVAVVQVFFIRQGQHMGNRAFYPKLPTNQTAEDVLSAFVLQFYDDKYIPKQLVLSHVLNEQALIQSVLEQKAQRQLTLTHKPRGERLRWLSMAQKNAENALQLEATKKSNYKKKLKQLQQTLGVEKPINRIECFDISHIQGDYTVASCTVLNEDGLVNSDYRKFNIKGTVKGDDYGALSQAVRRRFSRLKNGEGVIPDLLLIDGGKGQVNAVMAALEQIEFMPLLVVGISKGTDRKVGMEKLYCAFNEQTLILNSDSSALSVLQQVRDEAHRFAISGHRQQRGKAKKKSVLEEIPGLGPKKRQVLLKQFGGLKEIKAAGVEDLCTVSGINKAIAQKIYDRFHSN